MSVDALAIKGNRIRRKLARKLGKPAFNLTSKELRYPVKARVDTSEPRVFSQIFSGRESRCLGDLLKLGLIIDCGANVSYSATYFPSRFPTVELICIEPENENFKILQHNTQPYAERSQLINTGVWSETTGLVLDENYLNQGEEWGREVRA